MSLHGKHLVLGITGSIAAYKAAVLTRLLIKKGAEVHIVITPAGKEFITPVTLSALSGKPVISEFFASPTAQAQPRRPRPLGRSPCWWLRHGLNHRKNGQRHCRQHTRHHLPFHESPCLCCTGHGSRYVSASRHATQPRAAESRWHIHHRTCRRRTGQSSRRQRAHGRTRKHCRPPRKFLFATRHAERKKNPRNCRPHLRTHRPRPLHRQFLYRENGLRPCRSMCCSRRRGYLISGPTALSVAHPASAS